MSDNLHELAEGADPIKALLLVVGVLGCVLGAGLILMALTQTAEYGWSSFWSAHGGGLQMLIFGIPLLAGGLVALVFATKRKSSTLGEKEARKRA